MKTWKFPGADARKAAALAGALDLPMPAAEAMAGRGLSEPAAAERFLRPRLSDSADPSLLPDMDRAVERVWRAVAGGERIAVYGDYDVDGVTATSLVASVLERLGVSVTACIPKRLEEGYGLSLDGLRRCCEQGRPSLLLTVDCGTKSVDAVEEARRNGIDVVITDHHDASGQLAAAEAVVNPKRGADERVRMLAGVGVAFKVCHALVRRARDAGRPGAAGIDLRAYLDRVAVGTVADVVPLTHENRILVHYGLRRLEESPCAGLGALRSVSRLEGRITAHHLGFVLGPRLNAAGRLGDAEAALELMRTDDPARALTLARELDDANRERKSIEQEILADIDAHLAREFDPGRDHAVVVGREGWHPGVIGIVASRLCIRYCRPAVVVAFDADGVGRGSARSIPAFDLVAGLGECGRHLLKFGGHSLAAGLDVARDRFAEFRAGFHEVCARALRGADLRPAQRVDAWMELGEADDRLMAAVDRMAPFGEGNPAPVWACRDVELARPPRVVGQDHLKFSVISGGRQIDAIAFGMGRREVPACPLDVAFTLERNSYMGRESLQLNVQDFRPSQGDCETP